MKLNSKLTGGLAWAGLILVLAVPSADMLTKGSGDSAALITSDMDAGKTASVTPAAMAEPVAAEPRVILAVPGKAPVTVQSETSDPVETYISSGKKMPSYISDAPGAVATTEPAKVPTLVVPGKAPGASPAPVEVASVEENTPVLNATLVAPVPYPLSKRPVAPSAPVVTATVPTVEEAPLIVDEAAVARREAAVAAVLEDEPAEVFGPAIVEGDQLEEWDSGSLADYLQRRGLMSGGSDEASSDFDDSGFFLDEGPNNADERPRRRLRRDFELF